MFESMNCDETDGGPQIRIPLLPSEIATTAASLQIPELKTLIDPSQFSLAAGAGNCAGPLPPNEYGGSAEKKLRAID